MNRMREKLKSERGASILLALLLLLICMMVGASVLMAAASNAGKTRSNKDSHQAHLALSSALWLVIDDLMSKPYYGRYSYQETEDTPGSIKKLYYKQEDGSYECQLGKTLQEDMDSLFAEVMKHRQTNNTDPNATYEYKPISGLDIEHEYTVAPSDVKHFEDFKVKVTVTVGQKNDMGILTLQASLPDSEEYKDYLIQAELTAALPKWEQPGGSNQESGTSIYRSGPMQWKSPKITREFAEEAEP